MSIVLLSLIYQRWNDGDFPPTKTWNPIAVLAKFSRALGGWYWFLMLSLVIISAHTFDHVIAMILNTSPLSDTIVADSVSHEGFILWHSILTILDYAVTVALLWLLYSRWKVSHEKPSTMLQTSDLGLLTTKTE
jgi:hypothetical protein